MSAWGIVGGFVVSLVVNEVTDLSPWLARRVVRWAAHRWSADRDVSAAYAEEWTAVVDERPGKLFKLLTAVGFACGAIARVVPRRLGAARMIWVDLPNHDKAEVGKSIIAITMLPIIAIYFIAEPWYVAIAFSAMCLFAVSASIWQLYTIIRRARRGVRPS